jgi:putative inorganic carbon (HCO3(-)) transporter
VLVAAAVQLQMIPLPHGQVSWWSPHRSEVARALELGPTITTHFVPLSIDPPSTRWALAVLAGAIVFFWIARAQFDRGGVRQTVRAVAAIGFGLALLAVAQAATAGRLIYWTFPTDVEGPLPFGPFVNRNHFATWAIMAIPLCFWYLAARVGAERETPKHSTFRRRIVRAIDPRTAWLTAAGGAMLVALLLSLSRSGVFALGGAAAVTFLAARKRLERRQRRFVLQAAAVVLVVGAIWADLPALARRAAGASTDLSGRFTIWRESAPAARDFWLTGTGAGTYQRAMWVYQRSDRTVYFNQAHNHYLQVAVEGGMLLVGLLAFAGFAFVREARRRIAGDASGLVLVRVGAASGLCAVALQSVWETGLVMPANAAMAALLAAIVVHERRAD